MNTSQLAETVSFDVRVVRDGILSNETMSASRLHKDKYKLENGLYHVLQLDEDESPRMIMIEDSDGNHVGDRLKCYHDHKEFKNGKSLAAILTGQSHRFHYKDGDVLNNVTTNFEARKRSKRSKK